MIYISMQPTPSLEKVSSYGLLPRFIYISASGRVQKRYFEPFFSIHVIHVITNLGVRYYLFMNGLRTKPDLATNRLQYITYVNVGSGTQKEARFIPLGRGAEGYAIKLCSNPLPLYIPFLTKVNYPFRVSSIEKLYPFHISDS